MPRSTPPGHPCYVVVWALPRFLLRRLYFSSAMPQFTKSAPPLSSTALAYARAATKKVCWRHASPGPCSCPSKWPRLFKQHILKWRGDGGSHVNETRTQTPDDATFPTATVFLRFRPQRGVFGPRGNKNGAGAEKNDRGPVGAPGASAGKIAPSDVWEQKGGVRAQTVAGYPNGLGRQLPRDASGGSRAPLGTRGGACKPKTATGAPLETVFPKTKMPDRRFV